MIALDLDGALAIATLSRAPVNAIDEQWLARLDQVLDHLEKETGLAVLLLRSTERAFCAGADLALMKSRFDSAEGRTRFVGFVREIQRVFARLERLPQVTLAEIGGPALGGGLELALCCDLRLASDEARVGLPETNQLAHADRKTRVVCQGRCRRRANRTNRRGAGRRALARVSFPTGPAGFPAPPSSVLTHIGIRLHVADVYKCSSDADAPVDAERYGRYDSGPQLRARHPWCSTL